MTERDWNAEQATLVHQLDQIDIDGELRLKIQELILRWFEERRKADRRWGLREHTEAVGSIPSQAVPSNPG